MSITHTFDESIFSDDPALDMPYGQYYCPYCGGQIDTGFRCIKCGKQVHQRRSINAIVLQHNQGE